jgi:hypothetical protein
MWHRRHLVMAGLDAAIGTNRMALRDGPVEPGHDGGVDSRPGERNGEADRIS